MAMKIIRFLFVASCCIMGSLWALYLQEGSPMEAGGASAMTPLAPWAIIGGFLGGLFSVGILILLQFITQEIFERIFPSIIAIVLALVAGFTLGRWILDMYFPGANPVFATFLISSLVLVLGFIGISLALTRTSQIDSLIQAVHRQAQEIISPKLVDTSVLIDGRILDIVKTGFLEGTLLVPRFVLNELQYIADSSDVMRRARGRRGLDILHELQKMENIIKVQVIDDDPKESKEVDTKLVILSRQYNGKILTNDYNLNKVAQIDGVVVLNINDLANAMKPSVLPDEIMHVKIMKEGKESHQGVGYLDDGTMVVIDGGKEHIGQEVSVIITSVLQTAAGRMIFSRFQGVLTS